MTNHDKPTFQFRNSEQILSCSSPAPSCCFSFNKSLQLLCSTQRGQISLSDNPKFSTLASPLQLVLPQLASPQLASPQLASPQLPEGMTSTKKCHHFRFLQSHPQILIFLRSQYRVKIQLASWEVLGVKIQLYPAKHAKFHSSNFPFWNHLSNFESSNFTIVHQAFAAPGPPALAGQLFLHTKNMLRNGWETGRKTSQKISKDQLFFYLVGAHAHDFAELSYPAHSETTEPETTPRKSIDSTATHTQKVRGHRDNVFSFCPWLLHFTLEIRAASAGGRQNSATDVWRCLMFLCLGGWWGWCGLMWSLVKYGPVWLCAGLWNAQEFYPGKSNRWICLEVWKYVEGCKISGLSMGLFWWLIPDLQLWMLIIVYHQTSIEEIINRLLINGCKKLAQLYPSLSHQWNATASDMRFFMLMLKLCPQLSMLFLPRFCEPMKKPTQVMSPLPELSQNPCAVWCCMMLYVCHG